MKNMVIALILCAVGTGCNQTSSFNSYAQQQYSDSEITVRVKEAILTDGALSPSNRFVSVVTTNGVVTLTGSVSSSEQMTEIVNKAAAIPGVLRVDNQMTLSAP